MHTTHGLHIQLLSGFNVLLTRSANCIILFIVVIWTASTNLVLIAYASSEGSGEPAHPRSLARTFAARSYKQWVKRNLQTESQIPGPSEWLGMRSWNLSWRNARRHKFVWRGSIIQYGIVNITVVTMERSNFLHCLCLVHVSYCIICWQKFRKKKKKSALIWFWYKNKTKQNKNNKNKTNIFDLLKGCCQNTLPRIFVIKNYCG